MNIQDIDHQSMAEQAGKAVRLLKLLSNEHRLMALCGLLEQERTVTELLYQSTLSQSALSQHLANLREAGVVECRKDGLNMIYRLKSPEAIAIIETLHRLFCAQPTRNEP